VRRIGVLARFVKAVPITDGAELDRLLQEAKELLAIFAASLATAKENARLKAEARRAERERARRKRR
jgi:GAF domain-containing protein